MTLARRELEEADALTRPAVQSGQTPVASHPVFQRETSYLYHNRIPERHAPPRVRPVLRDWPRTQWLDVPELVVGLQEQHITDPELGGSSPALLGKLVRP